MLCVHDHDLWLQPSNGNSDKVRLNRCAPIGLQDDEENLLTLLDSEVVCDIMEEEEQADDWLPDMTVDFNAMILEGHTTIVQDILDELQSVNKSKWEGYSASDLFPDLLQNGANLNATCTVKDLKVIAQVLEVQTGWKFFTAKYSKWKNVNLIVEAFNLKNLLPPPQQQFNPPKTPKSLTYICNIIVNDKKYPNICLQSSYAYAVHSYYKKKWENYCMT